MIKGIVKNCHVEGQKTDSRHDGSGEEAISVDRCQVCIFNLNLITNKKKTNKKKHFCS